MNRGWGRLALFVAVLLAGVALARATGLLDIVHEPAARLHAIESLRGAAALWWVGPVFALFYAAAVAFALPASILTLIGGAAFGLLRGVLWVTLGANLGASLAFWLARRLGRSALEGLFGPRLGAFDRICGAVGSQGLLTLRLLPIAPFSLLNFAAGLTTIPWRDYAVATAIGILPGTVIYVFFADALLAGSAGASRSALVRVVSAGVLLVGFSLLTRWILKRRGMAHLDRHGSGSHIRRP